MRAALAAGLAVAALVTAAPAQADSASELAYLQRVNQMGFMVYDTAAALGTGYAICYSLNNANGRVVAQWVFENTSWSDVPSIDWANALVIASVETLCPWHDHSGHDHSAAPGPVFEA